MTFVYKYIRPEDRGLCKVKVAKATHNSVFKYRKRTLVKSLFWRYHYYADAKYMEIQCLPTLLTKILNTILVPVSIILCGVVNYKEVLNDAYRVLNPRKTGSFISDGVHGDSYEKLMK